jgi:diguanylate cyclase (GGDEF)-like protein
MKISLRKFLHYLESTNKWILVFIAILLVLVLGVLDFWSGFEFSFSLFYLFPVSITAWFINRRSGFLISIFSSLTWYFSNTLAGEAYSTPAIGYWNAAVRLGFFLVVTVLLVDLREATTHARELSLTDFMTGITNSRAFYQLAYIEMLRAKRYGHPFTLVYIDLDNFKQINDSLGHNTGDNVLKVVADTLKKNLRQTDIISRIGGDEFISLLPETDHSAAKVTGNKLQSFLLKEMQENQWEVTFSIGVITLQGTSLSLDEVIHLADQLMYRAKFEGKNRIRFDFEG